MPSTTETQSIADAIAGATEKLRNCSESPRLEAELLVARSIDMPRSYLFAHPEDELDEFGETVSGRQLNLPKKNGKSLKTQLPKIHFQTLGLKKNLLRRLHAS